MDAHSSDVSYAVVTARRPKPLVLRVERLQWREHRLIVVASLHSTVVLGAGCDCRAFALHYFLNLNWQLGESQRRACGIHLG